MTAIYAAMCIALLASGAASAADAREIFRTEDENGVVSFSDVRSDGAVVLELPAQPDRVESIVAQQQMIDQQLAVAKALEESRLKRKDARTRRIEALASVQPRTVYYQQPSVRHVSGYSRSWSQRPGYGFKPGYGHKPGHRPGRPGYRPPHPSQPINPGHRPRHGGGGSMRVKLPPLKPR